MIIAAVDFLTPNWLLTYWWIFRLKWLMVTAGGLRYCSLMLKFWMLYWLSQNTKWPHYRMVFSVLLSTKAWLLKVLALTTSLANATDL